MNEIDKNSTQYFCAVEPLTFDGWSYAYVDEREASIVRMIEGASFTVAEARALRDWLDKALPCEHKRTWQSRVSTDTMCEDCGATLP